MLSDSLLEADSEALFVCRALADADSLAEVEAETAADSLAAIDSLVDAATTADSLLTSRPGGPWPAAPP
ncbi:MAG: hypothetical protein FWC87_05845 [Acidimicrobiaceae bacterium]|nr:hypothetical protein [Acidimicrobiaceae bacterium]